MNRLLQLVLIVGLPCITSAELPAQRRDSVQTIAADSILAMLPDPSEDEQSACRPPECIDSGVLSASFQTHALRAIGGRIPGLFIQNRGLLGFGIGPGSAGNVTIRGTGGLPNSRVLMMIDGQPQFSGLFGYPVVDALHTSDFERIQIHHGPEALRYGSGAMGGVIDFVTREHMTEGVHGTARGTYGRYGTQQYAGMLSGIGENAGLMGTVNYARTSGVRKDRDDGFATRSAFLKAMWFPSDILRVYATGTVVDSRYRHPGADTTTVPPPDRTRNYLLWRTGLTIRHTFERAEGVLQTFHSSGDHSFSGGFNGQDFLSGASLYQRLELLPSTELQAGADVRSFGGKARIVTPSRDSSLIDHTRHTEGGAFLLLRQDFADLVQVSAGIRWDRHSEVDSAHWTPALSLTVTPRSTTTVRAKYGTGYRYPSIAAHALNEMADPTAERERFRSLDLSLIQRFPDRSGRLEIKGYFNRAERLMDYLPGRTSRSFATSYGSRGLEVFFSYRPRSVLMFSSFYAYLYTTEPIPLAPRHRFFVGSAYSEGPVRVDVDVVYTSGLIISPDPQIPRQQYLLVDFSMERQVSDGGSVFFKMENLLNRAYEIDAGYPMPGRSISGGLKIWW